MEIRSDQFQANETWIICRLQNIQTVKGNPFDIYVLLDAATTYLFGHLVVLGEKPTEKEVNALFKTAYNAKLSWPKKLITTKLEPARALFEAQAKAGGFSIDILPASYLDNIITPIQESFDGFIHPTEEHPQNVAERDEARSMIPDSYDPCPCASGKKYKFCCKQIFRETVESMCAFEEGRPKEALRWLEKAKSKVGETAEILCRYAIIYSAESDDKFYEYIHKSLEKNPNHPRAHYLLGLDHTKNYRLDEAVDAYKRAIECYPKTDKYHLNETCNNLANVYYLDNRIEEAKEAWEKALIYSPKDQLTRNNLFEFIYSNEAIPSELRKPSPFVERLVSL